MTSHDLPGGTYTVGDLELTRVGYGAMQLAGPGVFGPPKDRDGAIAVLREVVDLGIRHLDTSDYYGPYVTKEIIREALSPYPDDLHIVTKVGARRDDEGGWPHARTPAELKQQVHDNLDRLGLDVLDVVNLRLGGFTPLQSDALEGVAKRLDATAMSIALAWLLQRSPNMLLIPGTSSVDHLRENVAGAGLDLPAEEVAELDAIGR
jgi:aryl-alcohol dehydrogenase-like predicted oxidoreductase